MRNDRLGVYNLRIDVRNDDLEIMTENVFSDIVNSSE